MDRYWLHHEINDWMSIIRDGDWTGELPLLEVALRELDSLLKKIHLDS